MSFGNFNYQEQLGSAKWKKHEKKLWTEHCGTFSEKFWGGLQRSGTGGWARHASDVGQQLKTSKSRIWHRKLPLLHAHVSAEGCEMIVTGPKIVLPIFDVLAAKNLLGTAQKTGSATSCHSLLGPPALLCNHECGLTKRHQYNCDFIGFSPFFHLFCVYLALFHLSFTSELLAILNWHDKKLNHFGGEVAKVHWKHVKDHEGLVWLGQVVHASDKPQMLCLHLLGRWRLWLARHLQFQTLDQWKACSPFGGNHVLIPIHWWSIPLNGLKTSWNPVTNMLKKTYRTCPAGL